MDADELTHMFPGVPHSVFHIHDWRNGVVSLGEVPASLVHRLSEGKLDFPIKVELDRLLVEGKWDAILSVGQLVPHEVIGIANHSKNVFVGVGGSDLINKSHWLGAVYGIERIMGRADTPVREVLDYASEHLAKHLPIVYLLTVRAATRPGQLVTRGLYAGDDRACFERGAELCRQVNLDRLERAPRKVVVYLDPKEFKSTWLGNKAIYRTRMAIADAGEVIVLAPGVRTFGEDATIDRLIRRFGYRGTPTTLAQVRTEPELAANLSASAHLIHGSSEGRFTITYCPGHLSRAEIEGVGFGYGDLATMMARYDPQSCATGGIDSRMARKCISFPIRRWACGARRIDLMRKKMNEPRPSGSGTQRSLTVAACLLFNLLAEAGRKARREVRHHPHDAQVFSYFLIIRRQRLALYRVLQDIEALLARTSPRHTVPWCPFRIP